MSDLTRMPPSPPHRPRPTQTRSCVGRPTSISSASGNAFPVPPYGPRERRERVLRADGTGTRSIATRPGRRAACSVSASRTACSCSRSRSASPRWTGPDSRPPPRQRRRLQAPRAPRDTITTMRDRRTAAGRRDQRLVSLDWTIRNQTSRWSTGTVQLLWRSAPTSRDGSDSFWHDAMLGIPRRAVHTHSAVMLAGRPHPDHGVLDRHSIAFRDAQRAQELGRRRSHRFGRTNE